MAAIFATIVAWWNLGLPRLMFSPEAPNHARIEALEQFNRDTRLLVLDQAWCANPLGMLWPEMDAAFVMSGGGKRRAVGGRWSVGCRPLATKASWPPCRRYLGDVG